MPVAFVLIAILIKVCTGFFYGYVYAHYFPQSDSWNYFNESLKDSYNLLHQPKIFFNVKSSGGSITDFFSTDSNAFWSNAGENILIKFLSILNVLSNDNYYVDSILYNFLSFSGLYFLYRMLVKRFTVNKFLLSIVIFFLPSNLFWSSGIDKEGFICFFSGAFIYYIDKARIQNKPSIKNLVIAFVCFSGILLMRNVTALIFIPAVVAYYVATKMKRRKYFAFVLSYLLFVILFFISGVINSKFNIPLKLAEKQWQFLQLEGNSKLSLTPLQPTVIGYVKVLPQAIDHVFFRPYINEIKSPFYLLTFIENFIVLAAIVASVIFSRKKSGLQFLNPASLLLISIALTGYILVGLTVPFTGAIIRYKALYTIFLLLPFVNMIGDKFILPNQIKKNSM